LELSNSLKIKRQHGILSESIIALGCFPRQTHKHAMDYAFVHKQSNRNKTSVIWFGFLTSVQIQTVVFWVLKPLSQIGRHRRFGGAYCLRLQCLSFYGCFVVVTIVMFCVILTCSLVAGYQCLGGKKCLLFQSRGD